MLRLCTIIVAALLSVRAVAVEHDTDIGAQPVYPAAAFALGAEATVTVRFTIDESGFATNIRTASEQDDASFEHAARAALGQWRFVPRFVDGEPVAREAQQVLDFEID